MDRLSDYDYELPEERIAQRPLEDRSASRLLWLEREKGSVHHHRFVDLPQLLEPGDLLVLNDTRVSAVRLFGRRPSGGKVEVLLLRKLDSGLYEAMLKPGKRLRPGSQVELEGTLTAIVEENLEPPLKSIRFVELGDLEAKLHTVGRTPLPPYIHEELRDGERYQTVYAASEGSAAAPTAGLHFTPEVFQALRARGVQVAKVTLDVSIDTFRPVESNDLSQHLMHGERSTVSQDAAHAISECKGRIVAVGTTVVRTLESFALGPRKIEAGSKQTKLFIRPGYHFQVVDGMLTNFHLPRTTMLMMIAAMAGREQVFRAYAEALRHGYRFLSFGDSMLIL